jgi:hypothetical protein
MIGHVCHVGRSELDDAPWPDFCHYYSFAKAWLEAQAKAADEARAASHRRH